MLPNGETVREAFFVAPTCMSTTTRGRPRIEATASLDEQIHDGYVSTLKGVGAAAPDWA